MKKNDKSESQPGKGLSRRKFIGTVGTASALFTIVPRHTLGGVGYTPPSDLLNVAGIGVGGRGANDIRAISPPEVNERKEMMIHYADAPSEMTHSFYDGDSMDRDSGKLANIYALCDVDENRAFNTFKGYPKAKIYKDFRKMLENEKSIDATSCHFNFNKL